MWNLAKVRETLGEARQSDTVYQAPVVLGDDGSVPRGTSQPVTAVRANEPIVDLAIKSSGSVASKAVGKLGAGLTVLMVTSSLEKADKRAPFGYDVPEPDDEAVEDMESAVAQGFASKFPDANVPWWLGMVFAGTNLYLGTRRKRRARVVSVGRDVEPDTDAPTSSPELQVAPMRPLPIIIGNK